MGGTTKANCRNLFGYVPMPATYQQLKEGVEARKGNWGYSGARHLDTGLGTGWIVKDGDQYWLSDEVLAEGIAEAEEEIASWQKPLDYWQDQRNALAARQPATAAS